MHGSAKLPQNSLHLLQRRELGQRVPSARFYRNCCPNKVARTTNSLYCKPRCFSKDGKYLICFSLNLKNVEVYSFHNTSNIKTQNNYRNIIPNISNNHVNNTNGINNSNNNNNNNNNGNINNANNHNVHTNQQNVKGTTGNTAGHNSYATWSMFFQLRYTKKLVQSELNTASLCSDFCILTECGKYMILAEIRNLDHEEMDIETDDEVASMSTPNPGTITEMNHALNDIHFYVVRIEDGSIQDHIRFCDDIINVRNNSGVFISGNKFCVLSLLHQTIHIFEIQADGVLTKTKDIGWFCNETDEIVFLLHRESEIEQTTDNADSNVMENFINYFDPPYVISGLKQKILTCLYKTVVQKKNLFSLQYFYSSFDHINSLVIHSLQFLDGRNILLKLCELSCGNRIKDHGVLYVVYNFETETVISALSGDEIYDNIMERRGYHFIQSGATIHHLGPNIVENSVHETNHFNIQNRNKINKYDILYRLPVGSQAHNESPYFDHQSFWHTSQSLLNNNTTTDEQNGNHPYHYHATHFFSAQSDQPIFKVFSSYVDRFSCDFENSLCIFHPQVPFVLSASSNSEYFHFYQ